MSFHKVDNRCHIHKVLKIVWFKVRLKRTYCSRVKAIQEVRIRRSHIQEAVAREWNKCSRQLMKWLRISNSLELKAVRCQGRRIVIVRNFLSSHLKTSNNQREESQRVEWHQRIKFQRIKVIWTTVFSLQALVEINPQLLKTVLSLSSNNLVVQFRKLQLPDCHRSTLSPTAVRCKAKTSHTTQVRNNKLDISNN